MQRFKLQYMILMFVALLGGCSLAPDYKPPCIPMAAKYKEAPKGWKFAEPRDAKPKGEWWLVFNDPLLNRLEAKLNVSNQNIAQLVAQYKQAIDVIAETKAAYWPTLSVAPSVVRERDSATVSTSVNNINFSSTAYDIYSLEPTLTWSPDLFGAVRLAVDAARAGAQATAAQLANTQLSMQSTMAETYFQLRALDIAQKMLNDTVIAYKKSLLITQNQHAAGIVSGLDVAQAESQLYTAQTQALDNGILRGQYEHAIAVLIGATPESFSIAPNLAKMTMPQIPLGIPSALLERRPDIAQAERLMAQANFNIGVQIAAYFPILTLTGIEGVSTSRWASLFSGSSRVWSAAAVLAETVFDGGLRDARTAAARAAYDQSVAFYKQTVLAALQNVEDNLVALRILDSEVALQNAAVSTAKRALDLTINEYKAGTVVYSSVIIAQTTYYTAEQTAISITSRRMVAAVGLIQALGGGWENNSICHVQS